MTDSIRKGDRVAFTLPSGDLQAGTVLHNVEPGKLYVDWDINPGAGAGTVIAASRITLAGDSVDVFTIRHAGSGFDYNTYRDFAGAVVGAHSLALLRGASVAIVRYVGDREPGASALPVCTVLPRETGSYGIVAVTADSPGAIVCGDCGLAWLDDITPAGRCPWEASH